METRRRSATARSGSVGAKARPATAATSPSPAPHSPQNFAFATFAEPQAGQGRASAEPHSPQNFRPASFSVPQTEQSTGPPTTMTEPGKGYCAAAGAHQGRLGPVGGSGSPGLWVSVLAS